MTRRHFIAASSLAFAAASQAAVRRRMGIVIHSYGKRWQGKYSSIKHPPFLTALDVLDHIREIGAGGLQITVDGWTPEFAGKVRDTRESYGMYLEGSIRLPKNESDVARFDKDVRVAKEAGATIFRSAMGGRRYELFSDLAGFKDFKEQAWRSMQLAAPVAKRHAVRIGIENHKDFQAPELTDMLRRIGSAHIGACIDTGNSIALLEEPLATVETLAPFVVTTHIKDMAVQESDDGFLLSEVPLGQGIVDLPRIFEIIEKANPRVTWNLEMITRDPLHIACLTDKYWGTFSEKRGAELAKMLRLVREKKAAALPMVSDKDTEAALALEEENIVKCLKHSGEKLGLDFLQERKAVDERDEK